MNREEWIRRQQELVNAARSAGRGLTAEEQAEFDRLQHQIDGGHSGEGNSRANGGFSGQTGEDEGTRTGQDNTDALPGAAPAAAPEGNEPDAQRAVAEERRRISDIVEVCRETGMDPSEYIRSGAGVDAVRQAAVTHLLQYGAPVVTGARDRQADSFRDAAVDALLIQAGEDIQDPARGAEEMRGMSLRDILIESMARSGMGTPTSLLRMSRDDLWSEAVRQFMSPTADFPAILDSAIKKAIVHEYALVPETFEEWTSRGSLKDFKPTRDREYVLGGGEFNKVPEGGELKHSTLQTDLLPTRKLDTYGTQFSMTRQAFINDDIGFLAEMPGQYARRAKRKINRQVYELIFNNPAIFDGAALFDDAHKNLISSGTEPTMDALTKMILKFGMQTDQFGENIMVQPAVVIVPVSWGMKVEQILSTAQIDVEGIGSHTTNVLNARYKNGLKVLEEGTLNALAGSSACPWFMASDPRLVKHIQVDYLNGKATPSFRRSEKAGLLGYIWDIWLDWGINVRDFRGIARNNGAVLTV